VPEFRVHSPSSVLGPDEGTRALIA